MPLNRRQFLTATSSTGLALPFLRSGPRWDGELIVPGQSIGHRLRDGFRPEVKRRERTRVVIVGGGIAGLTAARSLDRSGLKDLRLLELDAVAGGNSRAGANAITAFPWGAHYLPLPGNSAPELQQLLTELGVLTGRDSLGFPIYREEFLCHDPGERLFLHGRWQEGLVPRLGLNARERGEMDAFFARVRELEHRVTSDGRPAFAIPLDRSSRDPDLLALDQIPFATWLDREGFRSGPLRWYVDYCCRDDFGGRAHQISAWAGLHYFASRSGLAANAAPHSVLTWPAGNGWLVEQLRAPLADRIQTQAAVYRIEPYGDRVAVDCFDVRAGEAVRLEADAVIVATPRFVFDRILNPSALPGPGSAEYAPWVVANLTLDGLPDGAGADLAWDNVIYESESLGYIVATHQHLHPFPRGTVLTWYQSLDHTDPATARREAASRTWKDWCDRILADLVPVHRELPQLLRRIDVLVWGHGMVRPRPGYVWDAAREERLKPRGRIHFAHSDQSGLSLFEEAHFRGLEAARTVLEQISPTSS
jgi:hypothetical protein